MVSSSTSLALPLTKSSRHQIFSQVRLFGTPLWAYRETSETVVQLPKPKTRGALTNCSESWTDLRVESLPHFCFSVTNDLKRFSVGKVEA